MCVYTGLILLLKTFFNKSNMTHHNLKLTETLIKTWFYIYQKKKEKKKEGWHRMIEGWGFTNSPHWESLA